MATNKYPLNLKIFSLISVFFYSLWGASLYVNGDQWSYSVVYNEIQGLELREAYLLYQSQLTAIEFVHFFYIWSFGEYIDKNILMSLANVVLAYFVIKFFEAKNANIVVLVTFLFTNFYLIVLYLAAERLKFGMIFLVWALSIDPRRFKIRYILLSMSILGHLQLLIVFLCMHFSFIARHLLAKISIRKIGYASIAAAIGFFIYYYGVANIINKLKYYQTETELLEFLRIFVFLFLGVYYASMRNKSVEAVLLFAPLLFIIYYIGGDRTNMIGYFYFLYYAIAYKRGQNLGIYLSTIYFLYKSIFFLENVIQYGNGFGP